MPVQSLLPSRIGPARHLCESSSSGPQTARANVSSRSRTSTRIPPPSLRNSIANLPAPKSAKMSRRPSSRGRSSDATGLATPGRLGSTASSTSPASGSAAPPSRRSLTPSTFDPRCTPSSPLSADYGSSRLFCGRDRPSLKTCEAGPRSGRSAFQSSARWCLKTWFVAAASDLVGEANFCLSRHREISFVAKRTLRRRSRCTRSP